MEVFVSWEPVCHLSGKQRKSGLALMDGWVLHSRFAVSLLVSFSAHLIPPLISIHPNPTRVRGVKRSIPIRTYLTYIIRPLINLSIYTYLRQAQQGTNLSLTR